MPDPTHKKLVLLIRSVPMPGTWPPPRNRCRRCCKPPAAAPVAGLRAETDRARLTTPFTRHYFETPEAHLARVGAPGGLFEDGITGGI